LPCHQKVERSIPAGTSIKKMSKKYSFSWTTASTGVKHLPHHPKVKCLNPAVAAGTRREKNVFKVFFILDSNGSTGVEHLPCHPKVECSILAVAAGTCIEEMSKKCSLSWTTAVVQG
jgi:hypothetical protein